MQKTLGGDRLGAGKKMKVELHNYERSTHDLGYVWRSTMAAGTLVPFMSEVGLPGDTFDINLGCEILTHPTIGPLFGSYKVQLDTFVAPIRLYNALLHNNMLGIGLNMSQVKLPTITLTAKNATDANVFTAKDTDNAQINSSCLLSYLGIRGIGYNGDTADHDRTFNATAILAYWEIYKQYFANKQEEIGAVLHTPSDLINETVTNVTIFVPPGSSYVITTIPGSTGLIVLKMGTTMTINWTPPAAEPSPADIIFDTLEHGELTMEQMAAAPFELISSGKKEAAWRWTFYGDTTITNIRYRTAADSVNTGKPAIATFPLSNIDDMRLDILGTASKTTAYDIGDLGLPPYSWLSEIPSGVPNTLSSQEGLGLKTYQSDLYNNWLQTEWIDGPGGIAEITAIDTSGGSFAIDTLVISRKVYDMLNRIAVSGGSYDDWVNAVYAHEPYTRCESPMYTGGLIKELVFQEVVSNSGTQEQPLGTLAGKGTMSSKHKGGSVTIKCDEPCYIIGLVSLTPRVDYSQGNKWDTWLQTLDDLHKPALDEIGFEEDITERRAWWDTYYDTGTSAWVQRSAGKQPAWMNYMTNVNKTYGNFAVSTNEMFMTLNRRYEHEANQLKDLTTYIDPSKFNFIFAETALDAQNFWCQIAVDITARRKMSAKLMPNL